MASEPVPKITPEIWPLLSAALTDPAHWDTPVNVDATGRVIENEAVTPGIKTGVISRYPETVTTSPTLKN